jgi:hypothetical protein
MIRSPQRAKFEEFNAASIKASQTMRASCPTERPTTVVARMELMEKRSGDHVRSDQGGAAGTRRVLCKLG